MAHKEKYSRGQIGHLCGHYDRSKECGDNVDPTLTPYNYNLAATDQPLPQLDKIHQRLDEVPHRERKDLKVMVDWVITAPKDLPKDEHTKFFESCYNFCRDRYGVENVVSAYVHVDEPNAEDHMHFAFVPVTKDGRWSAKDVVSLADLKTFHSELQKHVERDIGHSVGILNEATKEGNKSIQELKRISASKTLQNARETILEAERIKGTLEPLKAEYEAKKAFIDAADKAADVSVMYPPYAKVTEKGVFRKHKYVTVPADKWEAKHVSANEKSYLKKSERALEAKLQTMQEIATEGQLKALKDELYQLKLDKATQEHKLLDVMDRIHRVVSQMPEDHAKSFIDKWNADLKQGREDPDLVR